MFRRTITVAGRRTLNSFAVFAKSAFTLPMVQKAATFRAKSRIVHAAWSKLSPAAKAKFAQIAKRTPLVPRRAAPLSPWKKHVKKNYKTVKSLPFAKRLSALAKTYKK